MTIVKVEKSESIVRNETPDIYYNKPHFTPKTSFLFYLDLISIHVLINAMVERHLARSLLQSVKSASGGVLHETEGTEQETHGAH